ncbi:13625_t:CDS:2 [Funneliformis mosseae]|uniref:13625_t:CDS:1 n=1 Tax=Funneliformis mosseae TaxID=27381 RepID=A0A9N8VLC7_FUNMO|nr:13625_t:CDS:2 [Funneliformis mosseae]
MKEWKELENVQKVHKDLYTPSNSNDSNSDTYITLIIKSVFLSENERTVKNGIWIKMLVDKEHTVNNADEEAFYSPLDQYIEENGDIDDVVDDVLITNKDGQPENSDNDNLVMAD